MSATKGENKMREILYKRRDSLQRKRKIMSISDLSDKKDYTSSVRKKFIYVVSPAEKSELDLKQPQIYITKQYNSETKEEKFSFRVKGSFYMNQDRCLFKVNFRHSLRIVIKWKVKEFSPKKSVTLT